LDGMFFIGYHLSALLLTLRRCVRKKSLSKPTAKQHGEGTKRRSHATAQRRNVKEKSKGEQNQT